MYFIFLFKKSKKSEIKDKKEIENASLKNEIQNLKQILKSYEDQALKMSELEKKYRNQTTKHEKDLKAVEEKYVEKIRSMSKKIINYEEILKANTTYRTQRKEEDIDRVNVNNFIICSMMIILQNHYQETTQKLNFHEKKLYRQKEKKTAK